MFEDAPSALIRANAASAGAVRSLSAPPQPAKRDPVILALEAENANLAKALESAKRDQAEAIAAARTEALREVEARFEQRHQERLTQLESTLRGAAKRFDTALEAAETLSLVVNTTALGQIFEPHADMQELCTRAIHRQFQELRDAAIVELTVSAADFASQDALDQLVARLGQTFSIRSDAALAEGEARIALTCGSIEISVPEHWQRLQALFQQLAARPAP